MSNGDRSVLATGLVLPCGAVLANRLVKAAMSEQLADRRHAAGPRLVELYRRWAASGCGLLITGNMMVDRTSVSEPRQVVIGRDGGPEAVSPLARAAREHGAAVWAQLNHGGRQVPRYLSRRPAAPSAVKVRALGAFAAPRVLTSEEIDDVVDRFAEAAQVAQRAGFDGVQVHAAHGYLISQFLSPLTNRRTDGWGGDADRRMRLLLEVVRTVRQRVGVDFAIGVKLNSADFQRGGFDALASMEVIEALDSEDVDLVEISGGTFESSAMVGAGAVRSTQDREAYFHTFASEVRGRTTRPLMLTGGFRTGSAMAAAVTEGTVDLVGVARPLALDPAFARRVLDGSAEAMALPRRRLVSRRLDGLVEVAWSTRQLRRLGGGRSARPDLRVGGAVAAYLATTAVHAATRTRSRSGTRVGPQER